MKALTLAIVLFLNVPTLSAQNNDTVKKDTIYYLIDTARTPKLDRMFGINYVKIAEVVQYYIYCPCIWPDQWPTFIYERRKNLSDRTFIDSTFIDKKALKKISFIRLKDLIEKACDNEYYTFNAKYVLFFIEHLPNGRYLLRKVKFPRPTFQNE
ncbi:MAG: hypothetical protein ACHQF4_09730 [Sphingobacteriales bacterium]